MSFNSINVKFPTQGYTVPRTAVGIIIASAAGVVLGCGGLFLTMICIYRIRKRRNNPPHECDYCEPPTFTYHAINSTEEGTTQLPQ